MRHVPKSKIYDYAKPSRAMRELFVQQVDKITWQYKLAPETINLEDLPSAPEIQIFEINLKTPEYNENILRIIDKAINFPIFYELVYDARVRLTAAYKRPSEADSNKWVVDAYFAGPWLAADSARQPLPTALDLAKLYEQMLRSLMPQPPRAGESLKAQAARMEQIQVRQKELKNLESSMKRVKQFNRKVELNRQLRALKQELALLTDSAIGA